MPTAPSRWRSPAAGYVPELDGLRTLAIAAVLAIHMDLVGGGFVGVSLFFCLSGYLIGSLLLHESAATGTIRMGSFYLRRLGRLYPALVAMVLLIGVPIFVLRVTNGPVGVGVAAALALTYTSNLFSSVTGVWLPVLNPTWTLAQEEQFYLVVPWLIRRAPATRYGRIAGALAVLALVVIVARFIIAGAFPEAWLFAYENPLLNLDGMLVGSALAFAVAGRVLPGWLRLLGASPAGAVAAVILLVLALIFGGERGWAWSGALTGAVVAALLLLIHVSVADTALNRLLRSRPARWVGQRSYGIYLYHYPIFGLLGATGGNPLPQQAVRDVVAVAATLVVAWASARWLEAPVRRWVRTRFASPSEGPQAAVPSGLVEVPERAD